MFHPINLITTYLVHYMQLSEFSKVSLLQEDFMSQIVMLTVCQKTQAYTFQCYYGEAKMYQQFHNGGLIRVQNPVLGRMKVVPSSKFTIIYLHIKKEGSQVTFYVVMLYQSDLQYQESQIYHQFEFEYVLKNLSIETF